MKKKDSKLIIIIVLVLIIVLLGVFLAFNIFKDKKDSTPPGMEVITEIVTEAVTDENGEIVTAADGEVVTETVTAQVQTNATGEIVTEVVTLKNGNNVTKKDGSKVTQAVTVTKGKDKTTRPTPTDKKDKSKTSTTKKGEESSTKSTTVVTRPDSPGAIKGLKATAATKNSISISWTKDSNADGYEIQYSKNGGKKWEDNILTEATKYTIKDLVSNTEYTIRVRGYKKSGNTLTADSNGWATIKYSTEIDNDTEAQITIDCKLPSNSANDTIQIYVQTKKDKEPVLDSEVKIEHWPSQTVTTKKKYKGLVKVYVKIKKLGITSTTVETDKKTITLEIKDSNIAVIEGEDD